ncbi:MAG: hypothetical protein MUC49_06825 [Raineya sp.]|jgi:hypothetical protein|nr:hypothetical protein [Raineya sp.]
MLKKLILFAIYMISMASWAQQRPSLKQDSVRWDKENKKIIVPYKISNGGNYKYEYEITPFLTQDGGQTYKPMEKLKGHFGKDILEGENKQLWWQYAEENPEFDGQNLKIKLKADFKPSVFNLMNQEAMKYSVMLPGLGQTKVRHPKGWKYKWAMTSVAVYGLIAGSVVTNYRAGVSYDKYLESQTRNEAQSRFNEAKRLQRISYGLAILSAGIWATDIVLVGLRGKKNSIEKKRILKRNEEMNTDIGIGVSQSSNSQQIPTLGFRLKF